MWYRKVLKKHDNSLPQKITMKPKVQRDLHFFKGRHHVRFGTLFGEWIQESCVAVPISPTPASPSKLNCGLKKSERSETGNDFTNPQIAAIRNQSLIVWTVPSTSYGSDSLPGMKTPTTTPESPQRSEETHIEASAVGNLLPRKQMGKHDRLIEMDWDGLPLRFRFCEKMISSLKSHCLKTKPACLWKPMTRQVDYHFFPVKRALSANVQKFKSQMPHNRRHKSSVPSQV